jgi:uncharacterized protein (DUF3084 family)
MENESFDDLPIKLQGLIRKLRQESALFRIERNKARQELAAVRAELEALQQGLDWRRRCPCGNPIYDRVSASAAVEL